MDEAEASYRQALDIFLETSDRPSAEPSLEPGWLAHQQQRYDDAKAAYRQALEIAVGLADQPQIARIRMRLGSSLRWSQQRYAEAEISFQRRSDVSLNLSDWRGRSSAGTIVGISRQAFGRHQDATTALLRVAVIWRKDAGQWADIDLVATPGA